MQRIAIYWAVAILVVWIIFAAATLITHDYTGLALISPLMLLATGVVLGLRPSFKKPEDKE